MPGIRSLYGTLPIPSAIDPLRGVLADFKTEPYWHQFREFEASCDLRHRALFWSMRTGKSKVTIDTAFHNYQKGRIDAVLIFAPNGVHTNWISREFPIHAWDEIDAWSWDTSLKNDPYYSDAFEAAVTKCDHRLKVFTFPSSGLHLDFVQKAITRVLKSFAPRIMFVADESHDYRSPMSKRSGVARSVAKKCVMRRILSGTPVENSPLHAWGQFELLKPGALGYANYGDFEDRFGEFVKIDTPSHQFRKLERYRDLDVLTKRMAKFASVLTRNDCHDLPDLVPSEKCIQISDEQLRVYDELRRTFLLELQTGTVSVGEQTQKLIKMQQVLSGFVRDEFGDDHDIIPDAQNPRLKAVVEEVNMTGGRNIIWCAFRRDMEKVTAALEANGHEVLQYHGGTKSSDKAKARKEFEPGSHGTSHLVGHPVSGGSGLDLSAADKVIWYSHTFDAIVRAQADERATAMGGKNVAVVDFSAGLTDDYIRDNVKQKVSVAEAVSRSGLKALLEK